MTDQDPVRTADSGSPARDDAGVSRRVVLRGAATGGVALPLLAACSGAQGESGSGGSGSEGSRGATVAAADVPVGGGTILQDAQVVVTQPSQGDFKAFSAICTHQGCLVGSVTGGQIVCPCHGSRFSIATGKPQSGPAPSPLPPRKVSVQGGEVSVT
jgi:Rieske Fe-S protein